MTQIGETVAIGLISSASPDATPKHLRASVIAFTWGGAIAVSAPSGGARATVPTPHWVEGVDVADGEGTHRPGVIVVGGANSTATVRVKIRIDENVNVSGDATVVGNLRSLNFRGSCSTAAGTHECELTLENPPGAIQRFIGEASFGLEVPDMQMSVMVANRPRLEAFSVLALPATFYSPAGVWIEVLRLLYDNAGVRGLRTVADVAQRIVVHCHSGRAMVYDTLHGASHFGVGQFGGSFELHDYLVSGGGTVNCYDQAAAIQSLCGAYGVTLTWNFLQPYGFINETVLVGVGYCNNPFFSSNGTTRVVSRDHERRTLFGNHAFCALAGRILDACAGPHPGRETPAQYATAAIDTATTLYARYAAPYNQPGQAAGIVPGYGVVAVA